MKKTILLSIILALTSIGIPLARAQGNVAFANQTTTAISNLYTGQKLTGAAGTYMFGLYVGPAGSPASQLTLVGTGVNANWPANSPVDGFFSIGNPFTLANDPAGIQIAFQVRGWPAALGSSFEFAELNYHYIGPESDMFGESALGFVTPTAPPNGSAPLFGSGPGQIGGFYMGVYGPEPSSLTLGLLGAALFALPLARGHWKKKR